MTQLYRGDPQIYDHDLEVVFNRTQNLFDTRLKVAPLILIRIMRRLWIIFLNLWKASI